MAPVALVVVVAETPVTNSSSLPTLSTASWLFSVAMRGLRQNLHVALRFEEVQHRREELPKAPQLTPACEPWLNSTETIFASSGARCERSDKGRRNRQQRQCNQKGQSVSEPEDTIETAYGRLDRAALTQARESYDTAGLLRTVSELDQWIEGAQGEDGLADMLLRLHSMARTVINDAPMDVAAGDETLPDLALDLIMGPRRGHCQAARVGRAHRAA